MFAVDLSWSFVCCGGCCVLCLVVWAVACYVACIVLWMCFAGCVVC